MRLARRSRAKSFCPARNTGAGRRPRKNESRGRARRGEKTNTVRDLLGAAAQKAFAPPGTQEPGEGPEKMTAAGVRDAERKRTRCAPLPTAAARKAFALPGTQKPGEGPEKMTAAGVRDAERKRTWCASCSPQPRKKLCPARNTGAGRREKTTAAGVRDAERKRTRCASCSPQPREKLLPCPEHRSRAKAPKKRQPRACETRRGNEHGARLAHRSRAKSFCPARNTEAGRRPRKNDSRGRARRGEETNTVRVLLTAGVVFLRFRGWEREIGKVR